MKRRDLLKNGALIGAATILPATAALAASHKPVASSLSAYSKQVAPKATTDGSVHLVASIDDMEVFADHDARHKALPYEGIKAEGNVLSFTHQGTAYKVENVLPENFAKAVR